MIIVTKLLAQDGKDLKRYRNPTCDCEAKWRCKKIVSYSYVCSESFMDADSYSFV